MKKRYLIPILLLIPLTGMLFIASTHQGLHGLLHALGASNISHTHSHGSLLKGWELDRLSIDNQQCSVTASNVHVSALRLSKSLPFVVLPNVHIDDITLHVRSNHKHKTPSLNPNSLFQKLNYWPIAHLVIDNLRIEHDDKRYPNITLTLDHHKTQWQWQGSYDRTPFKGHFSVKNWIPPYQWTLAHHTQQGQIQGHGQSTLDAEHTMDWSWAHLRLDGLWPQLPKHALFGQAHYQGRNLYQGTWQIKSTAHNTWHHRPTAFAITWDRSQQHDRMDLTIEQDTNRIVLHHDSDRTSWHIKLPKLEHLWPQASGQLSSKGHSSPTNSQHQGHIHGFTMPTFEAKTIKWHAKSDTNNQVVFDLKAHTLRLPHQYATLKALDLQITHPLSQPLSYLKLNALRIKTHSGSWQLAAPSKLSEPLTRPHLPLTCLKQHHKQLCIKHTQNRFFVTLKHMNLPSLAALLPLSDVFEIKSGTVNGTLQGAILQQNQPWQGTFDANNITLKNPNFKTQWHHGTLHIDLQPKRWSASLTTQVGQSGHAQLHATFTPIDRITKGHFEGKGWVLAQPDMTLTLNPHIDFTQSDDDLTIAGSAEVTSGHLHTSTNPDQITLPANTQILGQPSPPPSMAQQIKGTLLLKTTTPIDVNHFMGFVGKLQGALTFNFVGNDMPIVSGMCRLKPAHYLNIPNIEVPKASIMYQNMPLDNPLLDITLARTLTPSLILDDDESFLDPIRIELKISERAKSPYIKLSANHGHLNAMEMMTALLSGSPNAISPTQNLHAAMKWINGNLNSRFDQPILKPFEQKAGLQPDEIYISTQLNEESDDNSLIGTPQLHMTKYLGSKLILKTMLGWSDQNHLTSLDYLINRHFHLQLYNTPRRQGIALAWVNHH